MFTNFRCEICPKLLDTIIVLVKFVGVLFNPYVLASFIVNVVDPDPICSFNLNLYYKLLCESNISFPTTDIGFNTCSLNID